jgi:hypothetical protein
VYRCSHFENLRIFVKIHQKQQNAAARQRLIGARRSGPAGEGMTCNRVADGLSWP